MEDFLKKIYYSLEDKWYNVLDSLDKRIPVNGIIDRVDKIIPSFAVICLIVLFLIGLLAITFTSGLPGGSANLTLNVVDKDQNPLPNISILLSNGEIQNLTTDALGQVKAVLPKNSKVKYKIEGDGFEVIQDSITLSDSLNKTIELSEIQSTTLKRVIRLVNDLGQPIYSDATLSFSCQNNYANASLPANAFTNNGIYELTEPTNCNGLVVGVDSKGFQPVQSFEVSNDVQSIILAEDEAAKGTITVEVTDKSGSPAKGIQVIAQASGVTVDQGTTNSLGQVEFTLSAGDYTFSTYDDSGSIASQEASATIAAGDQKTLSIAMNKDVSGSILVQVQDKSTKLAVQGATVRLKSGNTVLTSVSTDSSGKAELFVSDQSKSYTVSATADKYLATQKDLTAGSSTTVFELSKITAGNSGKIMVEVDDQDGKPVRSAKVVLYDADSDFLAPYEDHLTDINGIAKFSGVVNGNYKAFAFKNSLTGFSQPAFFDIGTGQQTYNIQLQIPDGAVQINVVDEAGRGVAFAKVSAYNALTNDLVASDLTDTNGTYLLPSRDQKSKADKDVYITVEKEGFSTYTSISKPILPLSTTTFSIKLPTRKLTGNIEVQFLGLYYNDKLVSSVGAGKTYTGKWQIIVPENKLFEDTTLHIRTGTNEIVEKDNIFIGAVNAPNAGILRGSSWNPASGEAVDLENITDRDAKWTNITLQGANPGVYNFEAEVGVKSTATIQDVLKIFYKVRAEGDTTERDPLDQAVKEELYAQTKEADFQVGTTTVCEQEFCFDASILDVKENLIQELVDNVEAKNASQYRLTFNLVNNGTGFYNNGEIRIEAGNKGISFGDYKIYTVENKLVQGTLNDIKFSPIKVGNFTPSKKVNGTLFFETRSSGSTPITVSIVSDGKMAFSKAITINTSATKQLSAAINPSVYPAGVQLDLSFKVTDASTGVEMENAKVKLVDKSDIVLEYGYTDSAGNVKLTLPGELPGETIRAIVEKEEYETLVNPLAISADILSITPKKLGVKLNAKTQTETSDSLELKNIAPFPLIIKNMEIRGNFEGILDEEKMNNWLSSASGKVLGSNDSLNVEVKTFVTELGKSLAERKNFDATMVVTAENFGQTWTFTVPIAIAAGISLEVDDPTCLNLTQENWQGATEGAALTLEFEIQNNCTIANQSIQLKDLSVKAVWQSNEVGDLVLGVFSPESPEVKGGAHIRSGITTKILPALKADERFKTRIDFTPYGGVKGEGQFKLIFTAANPLEAKDQILTSELKGDLSVVNLSDCISYDKEILNMNQGGKDSLTIKTDKCGSPVHFDLVSDMELSQKEFTMKESESKTLDVLANNVNQGQYPITVNVKGATLKQFTQKKTIRARVFDPEGCVQLNRYEFDLYDDPAILTDGFDTAELYNYCKSKVITAHFDPRDWGDSIKKGVIAGVATFLITDIANGISGGAQSSILGKALGIGAAANTAAGIQKQIADLQKANAGNISTDERTKNQDQIKALNVLLPKVQEEERIARETAAAEAAQKAADEKAAKEAADKAAREEAAKKAAASTPPTTGGAGSSLPTPGVNPLIPIDDSATGGVVFTGMAESGGFGGALGALGGVNSLLGIVTGSANPFLKALVVGAGVTLFDYYSSSSDETIQLTVKDVELKKFELFVGDPKGKIADKDVLLTVEGKPAIVPKKDLGKANTQAESFGLNFKNASQFVNDILFRTMDAEGGRHNYKDKKFNSKPNEKDVDNGTEPVSVNFNLQFNSISPKELFSDVVPPIALSCDTFSSKTGGTGPDAEPKIKFDWSFSNIPIDACDEGTKTAGKDSYIFCDGVQFNIELLKKVQLVKDFIELNSPMECPAENAFAGSKVQTVQEDDIGFSSIKVDKINGKDINVIAAIENNAPSKNNAQINIRLTALDSNVTVQQCTKSVAVPTGGSRLNVACDFKNLGSGTYIAKATVTPEKCASCYNTTAADDTIQTQFVIGDSGILRACTPVTTLRLSEFMDATEQAGKSLRFPSGLNSKDDVLKLVNFKAHLIQDRFSPDFYADFDRYARQKSFFNAPTTYLDDSLGLSVFFLNREKWEIGRKFSDAPSTGYQLPGPGLYDVAIDINFTDPTMKFFVQGEADPSIKIDVEKLAFDQPLNPFYYLPFDGLLGVDDGKGRTGYGVDFSGEKIKVNNDLSQQIETTPIVDSSPVATVSTSFSDSFPVLNALERSDVLTLTTNGSNTATMKFSPSYATPILLKVNNGTFKGESWGYYSVGVGDSTAQSYIGNSGNPWWGVGIQCRDFEDQPVEERFNGTFDHSAINTSCAIIGAQKNISYGFEWCENNIKTGNVFLKTVFYTPQNASSTISQVGYREGMEFIGENATGNNIPLNGTGKIPHNSLGDNLDSVENVLNLVQQNLVCVTGNSSKVEFFWNPKEVLNILTTQEKAAEKACITQ